MIWIQSGIFLFKKRLNGTSFLYLNVYIESNFSTNLIVKKSTQLKNNKSGTVKVSEDLAWDGKLEYFLVKIVKV